MKGRMRDQIRGQTRVQMRGAVKKESSPVQQEHRTKNNLNFVLIGRVLIDPEFYVLHRVSIHGNCMSDHR